MKTSNATATATTKINSRRPLTRRTAAPSEPERVEPELDEPGFSSGFPEGGDDLAHLEPTEGETPVQARRRVRILRAQAANLRARVAKMLARMGGWTPGMDTALAHLAAGADSFQIACNSLPDTFTPPRREGGRGPSKELEPGCIVALAERVRKGYVDVVDAEDMTGLIVVAHREKRVVVRTTKGEKFIIPRGHLTRANIGEAPAG